MMEQSLGDLDELLDFDGVVPKRSWMKFWTMMEWRVVSWMQFWTMME